jgi:membrane fusion protein, multidrug efflux system
MNGILSNQLIMKRIFVISIILTSAFFLNACGDEAENGNNVPRERLVPVETITLERAGFDEIVYLTGTVEALDDALVASETSGRVQSIRDRGTMVRQGDVIARIDDSIIRSAFDAAKAQYELAEDAFRRQTALHADSIISTLEYNSALAMRDQARAQLEQVQKQLNDANISAPISGRIEERFVREGELVGPGAPVVRIVNTDRVKLIAGVPERFAGDIREGSRVNVTFRSYSIDDLNARVTFAGNMINPDTRSYPVEIEISNPQRLLKPEMVADLQILRRVVDDSIIIPRSAIVRDEAGPNVFVLREGNGRQTAQLVSITTGITSGALVQVLDGLQDGDEIVTSGQNILNQGDRVNIVQNRRSTVTVDELRVTYNGSFN